MGRTPSVQYCFHGILHIRDPLKSAAAKTTIPSNTINIRSMTKKHILALAICSLAMLAILFGLYAISPLTKQMYRGGFDRSFLSDGFIKESLILKLPYNSYYIAGASSQKVYLGNWTNPQHLIILDIHSLDSQHISLKVRNIGKYKNWERFKLKVDSPYFFLTNGTNPVLLRGRIDDGKAERFMNDSAYFADAVPISKSSFVLRSYNISQKSFELAKEAGDTTGFKFKNEILQKQNDGIFCVEGMLHYDKIMNEITYVYTYRNQYIVTDTSLNLKYRFNTIDTFSHAPIKVADIESQNAKMLTGLPNIVNSLSSVSKNNLFIKSNVLAKNENMKSFVEGSTFDIYDTKTGQYKLSFNLYNHNSQAISDFKVIDEKLIALYGDYILIHTLDVNHKQTILTHSNR